MISGVDFSKGFADEGVQTVVPGFEYADHDFLSEETFESIVTPEQAEELRWLVRRE